MLDLQVAPRARVIGPNDFLSYCEFIPTGAGVFSPSQPVGAHFLLMVWQAGWQTWTSQSRFPRAN
jgi:hypothetical protein